MTATVRRQSDSARKRSLRHSRGERVRTDTSTSTEAPEKGGRVRLSKICHGPCGLSERCSRSKQLDICWLLPPDSEPSHGEEPFLQYRGLPLLRRPSRTAERANSENRRRRKSGGTGGEQAIAAEWVKGAGEQDARDLSACQSMFESSGSIPVGIFHRDRFP
ncbi:hypothetical protein BDV95DRAFT_557291 [Massariosphaeria phaeospora]|uniref:Uncharacterized protein n=1 Tax=Massariosphaeria phaeospora TaxID=100035 RepID=A0A7C8MIL6_9PLEO|nr:hypothetical protein BDV95DRAFT_557291 [Massariosphaeria phaeospora]